MDVAWSILWFLALFLIYAFLQWRIKRQKRNGEYHRIPGILVISQQEQNIFNISSRIPQTPGQYPDAFLSTEHITIANELNKPPKYDDAPPSYEEAIKLAMAQSNSLQTLQAEQTYSANQGPSSTSLSTTTVVPALPSRTTE